MVQELQRRYEVVVLDNYLGTEEKFCQEGKGHLFDFANDVGLFVFCYVMAGLHKFSRSILTYATKLNSSVSATTLYWPCSELSQKYPNPRRS